MYKGKENIAAPASHCKDLTKSKGGKDINFDYYL